MKPFLFLLVELTAIVALFLVTTLALIRADLHATAYFLSVVFGGLFAASVRVYLADRQQWREINRRHDRRK